MEKLHIQPTVDTPQIVFDDDTNTLELSGKSYPDNVISFYEPVFTWLNNYKFKNLESGINLVFKMDYFNTTSAKTIFQILAIFDTIYKQGKQVNISWYFKEEDDDMKEAGEGFNELIKADIELILY